MSRRVTHDGQGAFEIRFAFDRRLVDLVKTLPNRRWNSQDRFWWAPETDVLDVVALLQPEGFRFDAATRELYSARGGNLPLDRDDPPAPSGGQRGLFDVSSDDSSPDLGISTNDYTVSRLNEQVRDVLESAFPAPIWIVGEISGFNKAAHKRHVGFQLVERDEDGRALSEVNATLFERTRQDVDRALKTAGDPFRLEDEITVRVRARVELYVPWGSYRVIVDELDVNYTLGEAARRREEIIRRLGEAGLLERNTSLEFPAVPLRVGLITSRGSDAYNDVLRTLQESGFAFRVTAHGARVQGHATEPSVLNALDWFRPRAGEFDAVLICRGGGSRTDLAWFDSEPLGRAVATFPIPVVIGIGHEQDQSVLDAVGWRCKTPTAAARLLVDTVRSVLERMESTTAAVLERAAARIVEERRFGLDRAGRLVRAALGLVERERAALGHRTIRTVRGARHAIGTAGAGLAHRAAAIPRAAVMRVGVTRAELARTTASIGPAGLRIAGLARERIDARSHRLGLADPRRVVERGYAILRANDRVLTDPKNAPAGTEVLAELKGGALRLKSDGEESR